MIGLLVGPEHKGKLVKKETPLLKKQKLVRDI